MSLETQLCRELEGNIVFGTDGKGEQQQHRKRRKTKRIVVPPSQEDSSSSSSANLDNEERLEHDEGPANKARDGQAKKQLGVAGGTLVVRDPSEYSKAQQEGGGPWMKKRKERPKSPALSTTTTIDAYYPKSTHNAPRAASPATQAPAMVVGGLPASVWRQALRFVDNKSLAQNVCRVNRIFQRLATRVLRERERHSRTERQKQRAAAKNATDPGLFSSGHFVDGDDDDEEEEEKNEDHITNHGDHGVTNTKTRTQTMLPSKKDGLRPAEVIVVHDSPMPPTTNASRKSEETASTSPRRKKNEAAGSKEGPSRQSRAVSPGLRFKAPLALKKLSTSTTSSFFNPAPLTGNITLASSSITTSSSSSSSSSSSLLSPSASTNSASISPSLSAPVLQVGPPACRQHALLCVRQYSKTKSRHFWSCNHPLPHLRCGFHSWVASTNTTATVGVADEDHRSAKAAAQTTPTEPPQAEKAAAETEAEAEVTGAEAKVAPPSPTILERMRRLEQMRSDSTLIINILGKRRNSKEAATTTTTTITMGGSATNPPAHESDPPQPLPQPTSADDACDPADNAKRKKTRVDKKSQHQTKTKTATSKQRINSVVEVLVGCSEDQTAATLNYSQLFISPHTVRETQEEGTAYDISSSSSLSATALPAAALGEAALTAKLKPRPVGGVHEWSTELDETEPYSLTTSPSPSTPVPTTTTTTTSVSASSGSSTAEPPTREPNEAEVAAARTRYLDEAEVGEAATTPKSAGGTLLLRSREEEPSEDLLHSNSECVDQAAASGGDELEALRAEMRTLQAQLEACQSRNEALERENEQLRRGRDRDRDLLTSFHHQLALALHQPDVWPK